MEQHRAQRILQLTNITGINSPILTRASSRRLLNHPDVPELIRTSPLTQREWRVLGLIYSGYSNEQIAGGGGARDHH